MNASAHQLLSVQALIETFQKALRALVPVAEALLVPWREPDNYDDWDAVASGVFEGFVLAVVRAAIAGQAYLPFVPYDKRVDDYSAYSYLAASFGESVYALVCLETAAAPFDVCLLAELDQGGRLIKYLRAPLAGCKCFVVARGNSGTTTIEEVPLS